MNKQPVEKQRLDAQGILDVHSVFYTIQGEGPFAGRPAVFVRLAGCNLQCPLCDTDYTNERRRCGPKGLLELIDEINFKASLVVITGGEPFRQNITPAVEVLLDAGYVVQIETNGTLYLPGFPYDEVSIVCSPKAGTINRQLADHRGAINALKYVLQADSVAFDGLPLLALAHPASPSVARPPEGFSGVVYVQPADEKDDAKNEANLEAAVRSCFDNDYTLGIQIHKLIGVE